jgi:hypothetical protein
MKYDSEIFGKIKALKAVYKCECALGHIHT